MVSPWWSVPVLLAVLGSAAVLAVALNSVLAVRAAGTPVGAALVQPLRETVRLVVTQRATTDVPDAIVWRLGVVSVVLLPVLASAVLPVTPGVVVADLPVGLVWWTALMALLWVAVFLAGWGPNSHYSLVAGYRFVAQALAYEMPLAIVVITVGLAAGSLQVSEVVAAQAGLWFVVWAPAAFGVYLLCAAAASFWGPFATPTATDLAGGVTVELAGVDRLVFLVGRYLVLAAAAAFAVPLFLGGHHGPLLPGWLWIMVKTLAVLGLLVALRWLLPRVRMDRFEEVAWIGLIPLTLVQLFVVAGILLVVR